MAEDPDAIPSMQLAWEMIELARVIYKQRDEVNKKSLKFDLVRINLVTYYFSQWSATSKYLNVIFDWAK